jgi:hypothetical protein
LLAWEHRLRDALIAAGRDLFGPLLQQRIDQIDQAYQAPPGHRALGRRPLRIATLFGEVHVERDYYLSPGGGHCPADAALGLEGSTTPALARLVTRAAAQQPYGAASRDLADYGAIHVDERQIQRLVQRLAPAVDPWLASLPAQASALPVLYVSCDGTGTPMRARELEGRKGQQADGTAKTREVKLGAVFTQHGVDENGQAVRDHDSTTYVASYEPAADFSLRLRAEARRQGLGPAQQVVFLSDGAAWTEEAARQCFPGCTSILDFYHAGERIHELARGLDPTGAERRASAWKGQLLADGVDDVIHEAQALRKAGCADAKLVDENLGFLGRHRHRMRYGTYRARGWFVGSGVVEAGCRTVVARRLKQSGMFWSEVGATGVLNFRTLLLSRRFDDFWRDRANRHASKNDALSLDA